jgi:hypothetical protein
MQAVNRPNIIWLAALLVRGIVAMPKCLDDRDQHIRGNLPCGLNFRPAPRTPRCSAGNGQRGRT